MVGTMVKLTATLAALLSIDTASAIGRKAVTPHPTVQE